jgi:NitT/TauT family transport system substrate-binding protein
MRRALGAFIFFLFLLLGHFSGQQAEGQALRMGYSGLGIGADDLSRVMEKEKIWQKHGLDVKAIYFASGGLMAQAMIGGEIQTSDSDVPTLLNVGVSGIFDIKIIAVTINRLEHSFVVRNGINTTDDLRGKRIAVSRFVSASDITTRLVLRYWKLNPEKEVTILQSGNTPTRIAALVAGQIDGALINPSAVYNVLATGCCRVLMDLADLPMEYARTGQIVPTQFLKRQRQTLRTYMEAIVEGIYVYRTRPQLVLEVYREQGMKDPNAARQTYEKILKSLREYPVPEPKGLQAALDSLPNPKAKGAKATDFFDASILEEIKASGYIDKLYGRK